MPESKDILLTLLLLDNTSLGRYTLSSYLGLSKARTRVILDFLKDHHLAEASRGRGGTSLTTKGRELLSKISPYCRLDWKHQIVDLPTELIGDNLSRAVMLLRVDDFDSNGLYERDMAVREGARGALTLQRSDRIWLFPNDDQPLHQVRIIKPRIVEKYNLMIVTFGSDLGGIYSATAAIVLYHLRDKIEPLLAQ